MSLSSSLLLILVGLAAIARSQDVTAIWKQPQGNTCASWGDPHIWTWDGQLFSTQGSGYYHLLVSDKINVQAKFDHGCGGGDVTCVFGFRVFVVNDDDEIHSFELKADFLADNNSPTSYRRPFNDYGFAYMTYIDGNDAHMVPAVNGGDAALVKAGINQLIGANGGAKVAYYTDNHIYSVNLRFNDIVVQFLPWTISITPLNPAGSAVNELYNNVCGLCGTFNGNTNDDYQSRSTQVFSLDGDSDSFVASWKVSAADSKNGYFSCTNGPEPTVKPTPGPTTPAPPSTPFPTRAPTPAPTPSTPTGTPTGAPTPAGPTPVPTPEPTNPATQPPTSRPTNPATQTPTSEPTIAPTPVPTQYTPTPSVTTGGSTTGGGNQTTNITVVINEYNGTQAFTDANATCCDNAHICPGDPLYKACMMDVLKTNQTTLAVSATGAIVLAGCAKTNITDSSCTQGSLFACPGACAGAGSCVQGKCQCRKGFKNDQAGSCVAAGLTQAQLIAVGVSAGVVAAIVIGAVVFLALAGFGAKKGYDYYHMKDNKMANVNSNPLYNEKKTGGVSPLYAEKA